MAEQTALSGAAVLSLLDLTRKARHAESARELGFIAVNDSHALAPYRQAALWLEGSGVYGLSGVLQVEANVPYVQWLDKVCRAQAEAGHTAQRLTAAELPPALGAEWAEWLPAYALWLALPGSAAGAGGGLLLARDLPWTEPEIVLLGEWLDAWGHAWRALHRPPRGSLRALVARRRGAADDSRPWWRRPLLRWVTGALLLAALPVRLTVLAPGELVPAHPAVIRAPLDGVIDTFHVQPNQTVKQDQPLFGFDEALIQARLAVSRQAQATAEAEYRQAAQQALSDGRSKAQLALLTGKIEERRAEAAFVEAQLARARVLSPRDGVALFDDPSEWLGRPVSVGERIMRIAEPGDLEVEAWVPVADAIPLAPQARVSLYLTASPLSPVEAEVRYVAHDAVQRPDGSYAYRLRATLVGDTDHRVGLKGTAKLSGRWVPLAYWALRRPLASARAYLGW
ncbi:efflux RND transporter periplasmic adaptor subunit [Azoarcus olearius]|uniref:HlyD family secretion protein n=1 Tax=Azoarcus sp. (strain BH72) TaxID=418699 RepID=A1K8L9_AZOSB|nr:HlyD family secretion protein [Azoarcus olearius]CAL95174.1 HlyD family secretion protein [Azoarcus olearius]